MATLEVVLQRYPRSHTRGACVLCHRSRRQMLCRKQDLLGACTRVARVKCYGPASHYTSSYISRWASCHGSNRSSIYIQLRHCAWNSARFKKWNLSVTKVLFFEVCYALKGPLSILISQGKKMPSYLTVSYLYIMDLLGMQSLLQRHHIPIVCDCPIRMGKPAYNRQQVDIPNFDRCIH